MGGNTSIGFQASQQGGSTGGSSNIGQSVSHKPGIMLGLNIIAAALTPSGLSMNAALAQGLVIASAGNDAVTAALEANGLTREGLMAAIGDGTSYRRPRTEGKDGAPVKNPEFVASVHKALDAAGLALETADV